MAGLSKKMRSVSEELPPPLLPPGLVNQTNTCFFNSTLQALIATSLLEEVIHGRKLPGFELPLQFPSRIAPENSPAVTGRRNPTEFHDSVQRMPLCMEFVSFMEAAYERRDTRSSCPLSPRDLLQTLGAKHGQYLDFRQQDAHELLRQLLDAMDMEEKDEIKRRSLASQHPSEGSAHSSSNQTQLRSFVEMIFGGELTSFILCEGCRQVSESRETFMDLSLSLRPDERARKRDFLIQFVQKIVKVSPSAARPSPASSSSSSSTKDNAKLLAPNPIPAIHVHQIETPRSQSVPPGSPLTGNLLPYDAKDDPKRRSVEFANNEDREKSRPSSRNSMRSLFQDADIPRSGPIPLAAEPVRGRDFFQTAFRLIGAEQKYGNFAPVESFEAGSRASTDLALAENWAKHSRRERMEAFIKAVFNTAALASDNTIPKNPTSSSSVPPAKPTPLSQASVRWSGKASGLLDGLRRFTAVDVLEGENAFACKRCWKESQHRENQVISGSEKIGQADDAKGDGDLLTFKSVPHCPKERTATPDNDCSQTADHLHRDDLEPPFGLMSEGDSDGPEASTAINGDDILPGISSDRRTDPGTERAPTAAEGDQTMRTRALKRYLLASPPPILVIHLKRFQQITRSRMAIFSNLRKIDDFVDYPEILDMTEFLAPRKVDFGLGEDNEKHFLPEEAGDGRILYRLYAVVVHLGDMLGGHYIAYAAAPGPSSSEKNAGPKRYTEQENRLWYFVSDTSVRQCSREEAMQGKAYICFYQRI